MKTYNKPLCETCPFVKKCKKIKSPYNNCEIQLNTELSCANTNVVYCVECNKQNCGKIYVGQTKREISTRFGEHKTSVRNHSNNAIGDHFNGPGHTMANMNILTVEKVYKPGKAILEKRESLWINKLEAEFMGLNRQK